MGSRDIDAGLRSQTTDHEREFRSGREIIEDVGFDTISCQYGCTVQTEFPGHMSAIMGNDDTLVHRLLTKTLDVVGKTLGGSADHEIVHTVGTGHDLAAQSRRTEGNVLIKTLFDRFRIVLDIKQLLIQRICLVELVQPFIISF